LGEPSTPTTMRRSCSSVGLVKGNLFGTGIARPARPEAEGVRLDGSGGAFGGAPAARPRLRRARVMTELERHVQEHPQRISRGPARTHVLSGCSGSRFRGADGGGKQRTTTGGSGDILTLRASNSISAPRCCAPAPQTAIPDRTESRPTKRRDSARQGVVWPCHSGPRWRSPPRVTDARQV
jgi:hypothetical protein